VELVEPANVYKMADTPASIGRMVRATFKAAARKKLLLIAHMDTVYLRGMLARQPFASTAIAPMPRHADDKQGTAVTCT